MTEFSADDIVTLDGKIMTVYDVRHCIRYFCRSADGATYSVKGHRLRTATDEERAIFNVDVEVEKAVAKITHVEKQIAAQLAYRKELESGTD